MTVREKTRLEKFRQLLSSHNTDLGESRLAGSLATGPRRGLDASALSFPFFTLLASPDRVPGAVTRRY